MTAIAIRNQDQPLTALVSAVVAGGQPVDADQASSTANSSRTVKPSAAGSKLCVGVAIIDAAPPGTDPSTDAAARPPTVTIARGGHVVPVNFSAASNYGDRVKTDGAGGVVPWVDGTDDPAMIIGVNVNETGPVSSGTTGYVALTVS